MTINTNRNESAESTIKLSECLWKDEDRMYVSSRALARTATRANVQIQEGVVKLYKEMGKELRLKIDPTKVMWVPRTHALILIERMLGYNPYLALDTQLTFLNQLRINKNSNHPKVKKNAEMMEDAINQIVDLHIRIAEFNSYFDGLGIDGKAKRQVVGKTHDNPSHFSNVVRGLSPYRNASDFLESLHNRPTLLQSLIDTDETGSPFNRNLSLDMVERLANSYLKGKDADDYIADFHKEMLVYNNR